MSKVNLKKISTDQNNFYNIKGTLDAEKRNLFFEFSLEELKKIFAVDIDELLFGSDKIMEKIKNIYLYDEADKKYSCIGCVFSIRVKESVSFTSTAINVILENKISDLTNIKTNKVTFKTNYLGHNIHASYIKSYSFTYDSTKKIIVNTYTNDNFNVEISIESQKEYSYFKLSKILYTYIEMIFLIFGDMPTIKEIFLLEKDEKIKLYYDVVEKYNPKYKKRNGKEILGTVTAQTINKASMKKFEDFRKKTKIIYDLLMININSDGYIEIKNCNLVQIMEGMYKTIMGTNTDLRLILIHYFNKYKSSKNILSKRDKRKVKDPNNTPIFIYKANNHRNYLSHLNLNQNKNVFYKLENNYAYWKLCMCIRIYILEYLKIDYEKEYVSRYIKEIDEWSKKNKMRFSLKVNS